MIQIRTILNLVAYLVAFLGVAPLYPHLDLVGQVLLPVAFLWGGISDFRGVTPLRSSIATLLSLALFFGYGRLFSLANFIDPIIHVLALMLAIRLVSEKSARHYLQIFVLAIFALSSSSLLSLGPLFFLFLILIVLLVTVSLVYLSFYAVDAELTFNRTQAKRLLGYALILPSGSLVLMLFFFVILPRTERPLWNFLNPTEGGIATGFSESVQPGNFSQLTFDNTIAFRAETQKLQPQERYWRGIVLDAFDGKGWTRSQILPPREQVKGGRLVKQIIYAKGDSKGYLLGLSRPLSVYASGVERYGDGVLRRREPPPIKRYEMLSRMDATVTADPRDDLERYLRVPEAFSPRLRLIATELSTKQESSSGRVDELVAYFFAQKLNYRSGDLPQTENPIETFLFESRAGYCEYFASSFAVMLRMLGIPARLVGGYYGGEYNDFGGYYLVTEAMAHVWVEAYLPEKGWVGIDPSRFAVNAQTAVVGSAGSGLGNLTHIFDLIDYYWTQLVVTYDLGKQMTMARETRTKFSLLTKDLKVDGTVLWYLLPFGIVPLLIIFREPLFRKTEERLVRRFCKILADRHFPDGLPDSLGLSDIAGKSGNPAAMEFAKRYGAILYRDRRPTREERRELLRLLKNIEGE